MSRQGVNNCMVNLTQMAKPYGKLVADWLRLKSTQEYLCYRQQGTMENPMTKSGGIECYGDSHITFDPTYGGQIIVRKGNSSKNEQGTWCTDFHIALDFAVWLDPVKKDVVYDTFIKFLTGRNIGVSDKHHRLPYPKERSEQLGAFYAELTKWVTLKDEYDIAGLMDVTRKHVHEVLVGRKAGYEALCYLVKRGTENRKAGIRRQEHNPAYRKAQVKELSLKFMDYPEEEA